MSEVMRNALSPCKINCPLLALKSIILREAFILLQQTKDHGLLKSKRFPIPAEENYFGASLSDEQNLFSFPTATATQGEGPICHPLPVERKRPPKTFYPKDHTSCRFRSERKDV